MTEVSLRGSKGLKSVHDLPIVQDGPPPGGFPSIRYGRRIPSGGPTGAAIFGIGGLIMAYGFYKVGQGNLRRRALKAEKVEARRTLVPVLQAEEDFRYVATKRAADDAERKIMKDVPGWKAGESAYLGGRWLPPALSTRPNPGLGGPM